MTMFWLILDSVMAGDIQHVRGEGQQWECRVSMKYGHFGGGQDSNEKYKLNVGGYVSASSNASQKMSASDGRRFTTKNRTYLVW